MNFSLKSVDKFTSILVLSSFALGLNASVLTFDIADISNAILLDEAYGDRITAATDGTFNYGLDGGITPNVEVSYHGNADLSVWTTGYNDLTNVAYFEPESASGFSITFSADPGFLVGLSGFDLGNFGGAVVLPSVEITGSNSSILFSQSNVNLGANSVAHLSFDFPTTLTDTFLTIEIDTTGLGGSSDNVGIDNILFSQTTIPEFSASALLLGLMTLVLSVSRRRVK